MKNYRPSTFFISTLLVLSSCVNKQVEKSIPCIPDDLVTDIIAFYPFANGSLNDLSGNGHDLSNTTTANVSSDRNGNPNCAFLFQNLSGSDEFLTTANVSFLDNLDAFSISLWYQPLDTTRESGDFEILIGRGIGLSCPDRSGQWSVALYDCRKAVFGRTNSVWDKSISNFDCQQEINARTDSWHHLVATYNQQGEVMVLYRDGILQNYSTGISNCGSNVPSVQNIGDLFIGKNYTGKIDDLIIFKKMLNQAEVNQLLTMGTCCGE